MNAKDQVLVAYGTKHGATSAMAETLPAAGLEAPGPERLGRSRAARQPVPRRGSAAIAVDAGRGVLFRI
jgi:hypothetical protein